MKYLLLLLLLIPTYIWAQDIGTGGIDNDIQDNQTNEQTNSTDFTVSIPNGDVDLVTVSLCDSTGDASKMDANCTADIAKSVVIQFIQDQVTSYQKAQAVTQQVQIQ